ncbi:MAG: sulfide-dependent adenosine diphosphate thiazole synthase [Thermodesulfobacteriota bacterium]
MALDEIVITRAIIDRYHEKLTDNLETDVAIVGGGPSGLVAGYYLAGAGKKVSLYERKLTIGGGMWGGGMLFNEIVVQSEAVPVLEEFGIRHRLYQENYYTADGIEAVASLTSGALKAGLTIFNCVTVEDVVMRPERVEGLVINWAPVEMAGLHVDPLTVRARYVIDATGHDTDIVRMVENKTPGRLNTSTGGIMGQKAMWAEKAETDTTQNTKEIFPGLYVAGMAANATAGGPRMGPIFGGMLLSGQKAANNILKRLGQTS